MKQNNLYHTDCIQIVEHFSLSNISPPLWKQRCKKSRVKHTNVSLLKRRRHETLRNLILDISQKRQTPAASHEHCRAAAQVWRFVCGPQGDAWIKKRTIPGFFSCQSDPLKNTSPTNRFVFEKCWKTCKSNIWWTTVWMTVCIQEDGKLLETVETNKPHSSSSVKTTTFSNISTIHLLSVESFFWWGKTLKASVH